MKKIRAILFLFLIPLTAFSQKAPDNESIRLEIMNRNSRFYYPTLFHRYTEGDRTLTTEDYHYLYYGYAFQDGYRPYDPIVAEDDLLMLMEQYPDPETHQADLIVRNAMRVFSADPFSPRNINFLTYAYQILGDTLNARINADRLEKILYTIENSGEGTKEASPWHVLMFSHGDDLLAAKDLQTRKKIVVSTTVEYAPLRQKTDGIKGYYFDFSRIYSRKPERTRRVDGFELNGIQLRKNR